MKGFITVILVITFLIVGGLLIKVAFFPIHTVNNLVDTAYDVQDKTLNADNAIYNYEWFKQTHEDIKATENKIINAQKRMDEFKADAGERINWTFDDKQAYSILTSNLSGLESYYEDLIAQYNARAKMANRNIFDDKILPTFIETLTFIKK